MKKNVFIIASILFVGLVIFSIIFISSSSKTSFAESNSTNNAINNKNFKIFAKYKNEIDEFLFPEDLLKFKFTENLVYHDENGNSERSNSTFNKGDKHFIIFNGLLQKDSNLEE